MFFANNLLMPLWLQTQVGYTATWAGLVAAPTGVVAVLLTPLSAKLMSKVDARIIATVAFIAFGVSYLMRSSFTADASFLDFMLPLLVQGIAMATFFLAMITILLDGVPPQHIPLASGLSQLRAHHRRRLRRLHRHHPVGPARGAAPEPAGRPDHHLHARPDQALAGLHSARLSGSGGQGGGDPHHDQPGLSAGGGRYLLGLGLDLHPADRHGLAVQARRVRRRRAGRGGLDSASTCFRQCHASAVMTARSGPATIVAALTAVPLAATIALHRAA